MVRLREIQRTAVFAWSPEAGAPLIVTGTRAGAVNDDFSSEIKLELWDLGLDKPSLDSELSPAGTITTDSGFNDIAWSEPDDDHPLGVIAGALENGSVDLWDAAKLRSGSSEAFISRTTKHSGSAKALQWNPHRPKLLASVGAKGEIFIYELSNMANPYKLGAAQARADDIECLDWNKQEKTAHILATGSSGGFVTIWDVKKKSDILTLNNQGRKAVSAVAWDPEESTKLATATPNDQDPLIFLWSLRNSSAPERTLKGHELGVLGLAWCVQDPDLLLSCGKDNQTICWNPKTGEKYGDFAAGSNWAFQTKWNPHNPNLIASASFDGKILIASIQSTNAGADEQTAAAQALDAEDFFAKAQAQPQRVSFSIPKAPKWTARPASVSFGFGGKLVRISTDSSKKSKVSIENFVADGSIGEAAEKFEEKLRGGDIASICTAKIEEAKTDEEKADWQVIETLNAGKSRKKLRQYLGFDDSPEADLTNSEGKPDVNGDVAVGSQKPDANDDDDDDFFGSAGDGDNFLADLAATKGTRTNNPFQVYSGSESDADKSITQALISGQFEVALDICLKEDRISDAFMIAVCGGQKCIDKAQNAYLKKQARGPNYLRLLSAVVGKNLWDVVHNASLKDWKDVMATLCTYADETEFSDLCEALGDRLEEAYQESDAPKTLRRDASFCFLAGAKLEKVVNNWVQEFEEQEKAALEQSENDNSFSVHAQCLLDFVEKVSVFRKITNFQDTELQSVADWKLAPLYGLYAEYADILAAQGQLASAEQYLDLLPPKFNGADSAQERVKQATKKANVQKRPAAVQRTVTNQQPTIPSYQPTQPPLINQARNAPSNLYAPVNVGIPTTATPAPVTSGPYAPSQPVNLSNPYAPPQPTGAASMYAPTNTFQQSAGPYAPPAGATYGSYAPLQQTGAIPPPPRGVTASPSAPPPSAAKNMTNWNDMPEGFLKERQPASRRGTPAPAGANVPFNNFAPNPMSPPPPSGPPTQYGMPKSTPPLPPPPKAGEAPPRITSPPTGPPQAGQRTPSTIANVYAPTQPTGLGVGSTLPPLAAAPPVQRGASPYQPPPSTSSAAPSNRYAPAPGSQGAPTPGMLPQQRTVAPNPYQAQPNPYAPQQPSQLPYGQAPPHGQAPPPPRTGPPPQGPPRTVASGPPPQGPPRGAAAPPVQAPPPQANPNSRPSSVGSQAPPPPAAAVARPRYPRGDRSHIPANAQPVVDLLSPEIARIKSIAPPSFKLQVDDMEKRIEILFDHLNNQDLLQPDTVEQLVQISQHVQSKEWDQAQSLFVAMQTAKSDTEGAQWMTGISRLLKIGRASKT